MSQLNNFFSDTDPAAAVHVGTPTSAFNNCNWEKIKVYFHDFENESCIVAADGLQCLGHQWRLYLEFYEDTGLDFYLINRSYKDITIKYGISIKDYNDNNIYDNEELPTQISACDHHRWNGRLSLQQALNGLVYGTLVVEVRMKRPENPSHHFIPPNPSVCDTIKALFMDEETADVIFEVGGVQAEALMEAEAGVAPNERKTMKQSTDVVTEPKTFFAHSLILKKAAPLLAEMCASDDNDGTPTTIQIPNVKPDTFHGLLHYIYGLDIPDFGADISHTKEFIEAADRYGLSKLKLKAEVCYVSSLTVTMENVMEHLHFADSKNCALLKETIMDFIVENRGNIIENSIRIMTGAPIDLVNDVLAAIWRVEKKGQRDYVNDSFSVMSINELRERAHYEGVEEDGSRESLIASLKQVQVADAVDGEDEEGGEEGQAAEMEE